jgi:hypothetical protein
MISPEEENISRHIDPDWLQNHFFGGEGQKSEWYQFFVQLLKFGQGSKPSAKWLNETKVFLERLGEEKMSSNLSFLADYLIQNEEWFLGAKNHLIKGLLWVCTIIQNNERYPIIKKIIAKAYTKLSGFSALSTSVGNTGLAALLSLNTVEAMQAMLELKAKTKYNPFIKALDKHINLISKQLEINPEDISDRMIPEFGLSERAWEKKIGDYTVQIYWEDYQKHNVEWLKSDGKVQKTEPSSLKKDFPKEIQNYKQTIQAIKQTLQTQKHRLEAAWRENRVWSFVEWQKYLIQHPLMSMLTHSLIWEFESPNQRFVGIFNDNKLVDNQSNNLPDLSQSQVKLWHPVNSSVSDVLAWRDYIFKYEIKQPFKQAFREVYVLTEAELKTKDYSNRFSAHILKQNVLWALTQQREWKYQGLYGYNFDSPTLYLKAYKLKAELAVSFNHFQYATTQRVIFSYLSDNEKVIELEKVPLVAFSEVMRDIDLFIAVSSIGNDPNWTGSDDYEADFEDYWQDYAFGEKSETTSAKTRKEVLERIVPRLKISQLCSFEGNFLVVKGKIRTYKINIGSGNILMKPNDQYLCIVPDRSKKSPNDHLYLPFDSDNLLSLILSKAFLLAEDAQITDKTILSQINQPSSLQRGHL